MTSKQRQEIEIEIGDNYYYLARTIMRMDRAKYNSTKEVIEAAVRSMREKYREKYGK